VSKLIHSLTADSLCQTMQSAGFKAEIILDPAAGGPIVRSATNGVGFDIHLGNKSGADRDGRVDAGFAMTFKIVGDIQRSIINKWNNTRRFARLLVDDRVPTQELLVLSMDIVVAGGVAPSHLRSQIEIWDRLVRELIAWLPAELSALRAADGAKGQEPIAVSEGGGDLAPGPLGAVAREPMVGFTSA